MKSFYRLFLLSIFISFASYQANAEVTAAFISFQDPSCFGAKDGFVTIDSIQTAIPTGPTYTITVNFNGNTSFNVGDTVFGLGSGSYSITIKDDGDGGAQLFPRPSFVITEPFQISTLIQPTPASCFDTCDGKARVLIGNGVSPFVVGWSDPLMQDSTTALGLCDGEYFVTVTDDNGCSVTDSITIVQPTQIQPNVTVSDANCFGGNDGSATSIPSGGSGTYTNFEWSSSFDTTSTESGLIAGTYTLTVTDDDGCIGIESFIVDEPADSLSVSLSKSDVFCFGGSSGFINTARSGGTPPYTYEWSDGPSANRNRNGLLADTYTVSVTDQNGCSQTASAIITERPAFSVSFTQVDNVCNGDSAGSITASISGATPNYSYDWSESTSGTGASSTISSLAAGTYIITITDALNCTFEDSVTITEPSAIAISLNTQTNPLCNGASDGSINIDVSGGTPAYTFAWSNSESTEDISGLPSGTYTVVVSDNNSCSDSLSFTLLDPPVLSASIDSLVDASCNGSSDGFARVLASGGTGVYTYSWSNGPASAANPNLAAATYTVTVTDSNNCSTTVSAIVDQPVAVVASITSTDASCAGINDGTATASGFGGTSPYTFLWSTADTTVTITGLSGGTYTVTITDNNGCDDTESIIINQPTAITTSTSKVDADCNGASTGSATVTAAGGTPAYTFQWDANASNQTSATATSLPSGKYFVTVSDNNGCSALDSATVDEPTAVVASINSSTDPACNGGANGTATASAIGGTGAYTFQWDANAANQITATATGLGNGSYVVTVTDANGCADTSSVTLTEPLAITINTDSIAQISCNGANDGFIRVSASGGTLNYTYTWPGPIVADSLSNLSAGNYTVTVTDGNLCTNTRTFAISEPTALSVSLAITDETCNGVCDGAITANPSGGTLPYTYAWSITATSRTISGLCPGTYTVTVADNNGCTATQSGTVDSAAAIVLNVTATDVSCNGGSDGGTNASATGGAGSFTYSWTPPGSGAVLTNLSARTYTVTATDGNACETIQSVVVNEPDSLNPTLTTTDVTCGATANGTATVSTAGGTVAYTFLWGGPGTITGQGTASVSGLIAGAFTVTVSDANGCDTIQSFTINSSSSNFVFTDSTRDVSCFGVCDGFAGVFNLSGGTTPYTFSWNNALTGSSQSNLCPGIYTLTISDANSCDTTINFTINEPDSITTNLTTINESCAGNDGEADASLASGGTSPYTYAWSGTTDTTSSIDSLIAGNYTLTITDANSCQKIQNFVIGSDAGINDREAIINESCVGESDGRITLSPSGGIAPYNFVWEDSTTQFFRFLIGAGTYTVTITDNSTPACSVIETYVVTAPDTLKPTLSSVNTGCVTLGSASVSTIGGSGSYTFDWGPGNPMGDGTDSITGLSAGNYSLTVTDSLGCDSIQNFSINAGSANFTFRRSITNDSCFGQCNGFAGVSFLSGGTSPYTFNWDDSTTNSFRNNLCAGNYSLTISDANSCDSVVNFTITEPDSIAPNLIITDESCSGGDGEADASLASGGTAPFTYAWSVTSDTTSIIDSLSAGTYTLTITDANNCEKIESFIINSGSGIDDGEIITNVTCGGDSVGEIRLFPSGGNAPYNFVWDGGSTQFFRNSIGAGTYTVTITDNSTPACSVVETYIITEPDTLEPTLSLVQAGCAAVGTGSASVTTTGGSGSYTFNWGGPGPLAGQGTSSITGLSAGNYSLTVTDSLGCDSVQSFTISSGVSNFVFTDSTRSTTCFGVCDGFAGIFGLNGGNPPYTFNWNGSGSNSTRSNLCAGNYSLTISDASGCDSIVSFTVLDADPIDATITTVPDTCVTKVGNASVVVNSGGTGPYTFTWPLDGPSSGNMIDSLFAGNYELTITDATGCSIVKGFSIGNIAPFNINITSKNITCNGDEDGEINVSAAGGTNPLTYRWTTGTSFLVGSNPRNVTPGTYTITITDANGCAAVNSVTVTEPDVLETATSGLSPNFYLTPDFPCTPVKEGTAIARTIGGTRPYTYTWSGGIPNDSLLSDLATGTYFMSVTDANGCFYSTFFKIESDAPFTLVVDTTPATCGGMNGTISLSTFGAIPPLTYDWQPGSGFSGANQTMLAAGNYPVTVTDGTGCSKSDPIVVRGELELKLDSTNITDESCSPGLDGSAKVFISGGVGPYTYKWSPDTILGLPVEGTETDSIFNLSPTGGNQSYRVVVTDATGCTNAWNAIVKTGADIDENSKIVPPTCFGDCDGSLTLSPIGGVRPYLYLWDDNSIDSTRTNLCVGNYQVTITDNATPPCIKVKNITLNNRPILTISEVLSFVEQCVPGNDGSAAAQVGGGTPPYTYAWSSGIPDANNAVFGLKAGIHSVTVTDSSGCTTTESFQTFKAQKPIVTTTSTNPKCNGSSDGTINVNTSLGSNPFTYNWTGGPPLPVGADPKNVPAGTYTISVIDLLGCEGSSTVTLIDQAPITDTLAITNESCSPGDDGAAVASPTGGTPPYSYTWPSQGTSSGNTISGLKANTYNVTVTDDSLCSTVIPFTIGSDAPFNVTVTVIDVSCVDDNNGSISVTTTAASPSFDWATLPSGANQTSLRGDTYFLTVTDGVTGCKQTETIVVDEPDSLKTNAIITNVSCIGSGSDGAIDLNMSGGTLAYTFDWGAMITTEDRSNLAVGAYTVTVTDGNSCSIVETFNIIDEPTITVDLDSVNVRCNGGSDGSITLTTSSLNPTFNWSPSVPAPTQGNQINLLANTYKVTVTDGVTGCTAVDSITVNQPLPFSVSFLTSPASCSPGNDGEAIATVSGGTPPYTYGWPTSGMPTGNSVIGLAANNYNLTLTDRRGCSKLLPFTIGSSAPFTVSFTNKVEPNCFGDSSGQFTTNVVGAGGPLGYTWNPSTLPNQANQVGLPSGTYTVTVTDQGDGCTETASISIMAPSDIVASATIVRETCSPGTDGEINLTVFGGTAAGAYTYNWSANTTPNQTAQNQTGLTAGSYEVTITDDNGCFVLDTFIVGSSAPFTVSVAKTDLDCFGDANGTIDITTGGSISGTLSYTWRPMQTNSPNLTGLAAGTYDLTITDSGNGCLDTRSIIINGPLNPIAATAVSTPESCSPANDGSLTPTVTGGTSTGGVYIYNWSGFGITNPSNKNQTNLASGPYTVTITDDKGCSLVETFNVGVTAPFIVDLDSTDVSCFGLSDGSILAATTASNATYMWSSNTMAGNIKNPTGLPEGTYTVTVTEPSSGCAKSVSIVVNEPGRITANFTVTNSTCGNPDGSIQAAVSGGTTPRTITWLDASKVSIGQTGSTANNLAAGTYFAAIADANSCSDTLSALVNDDNGPTATIAGTDPSCSNICDGTATVTSACLSTTCVIQWRNDAGTVIGSSATISNLCPGDYFAEVTDNATNCVTNLSITINKGASIDPQLSTIDNACNASTVCSGEASVNPSGGVTPYTYVWSGPASPIIGQGTDSIFSLCPGNYDLTITDANGCDTTLSFAINPKSLISPNATSTNETCAGANDGTISLAPSGGTIPYTFNWSPVPGNGQGVANAIGLSAQNYAVTISDASGCDTSITINIGSGTFVYSIDKADLSCNGTPDGTADVTIVGGSAGYSFIWAPTPGSGQGTANVSGLLDVKYKVTITSGAGCSAIDSVTINSSTPILPNESFTDEACVGLCNGTIDLNATGGAGAPFTYTWLPVPPNGQGVASATGLCSGNYSITITDASLCDTVISIAIQGSTSLVSIITTEDMSCNNSNPCNGSASIAVSGGVAPYTYNWSAGNVIGVDGDTVNALCEGNYQVTVSDANGCSSVESFSISAPPAIVASFTSVNSTCNFSDGSITVTASGGTAGFAFAWFDVGMNALSVTTPTISGIASGIYFVEITDNTGCSEQFSTSVSDDGGELVTTSQTDVTCFGASDGTAKASYNCGDPTCSVEWFDGTSGLSLNVTIDSISNLKAGDYFVQVTNNSGCKTFESVRITQPDPFAITATVVDETCNGGCNGSINVGVTGGTGSISYNWGPGPLVGQGTSNISNLCSGNYSLTVTDDNGCDSVFTFSVGQPIAFSTSFSFTDANCSLADGSITATVNGGIVVVDYDYQWFDGSNTVLAGETNATINNISAGSYFLRVRDDNVCEERFTAVLGNKNGPTVVLDSTKDAGCFGGNDGAVFITASGNNTPLTYNWVPQGQTTEDIINLSAGTYIVEVIDALGCVGTETASIIGSDQLIASISTDDATCGQCNGEADLLITGGTAPYTYLWSNGSVADTAGSLCGGAHSVVITDANGCSITETISINTDGGPTGETVTAMATSCATSCDGTVTVTPIGGNAPYTYLWQHNSATTNSLTGLCKGTYFLQISDVSGCSRNVKVDIDSPNQLIINDQVRGTACNATCEGTINLNISGGLKPYTYAWGPTPQNDSNFIDGLCAGIYNVTVSDANGCSQTKTITVSNNGNPIVASPTATDANCFGTCDGSLVSNLIPSGSVAFRWYDNQGAPIAAANVELINSVCAGEYILETTSLPEGCKSYLSVIVDEPDSITIAPSVVKNVSCAGSCDGEIFISSQGGTLLFSYSWSDSQTEVPATDLCAGTYTVTATDVNGCTAVNSVTLVDPPVLTVSISGVIGLNCSSDCDASATATANGGVPPYDFNWDGGQTGFNPTDLCFGQNVLTVTDATGCILMDTVNISATDTVIAEVPTNTLICSSDSINLDGTAIGSTVNSVGWYEADTTTLITNKSDTVIFRPIGDYTFFFIVSNGSCSDTTAYTITLVESPMVGVPSPISIFKDEVANIKVTNQDPNYLYNWNPGTDLTDSTIAEPISSTRETRIYTLTVIDTNNCTYLDSVEVIYSPDINIPSGFSPNGDGKNDVWRIDILEEFPSATVQVYNRWGELLYEQGNGYSEPWDGTYEGKALPIGTYYYIVDFKSSRFKTATGPITIVK